MSTRIFSQLMHIRPDAFQALVQRSFELIDHPPVIKSEIPARPDRDYYDAPLPKAELIRDVAVVPIVGPLVKSATGFEKWAYSCTSHEDIHEDLSWAENMHDRGKAKGILLKSDSPGGHHMGCAELAARIAQMSSRILVLEYCENVRASAAEYITAGATGRFCARSSMTGSIGSMMEIPNYVKFYEQRGVTFKTFTSGKYKAAGSPLMPMPEDHEQFFQAWVDRHANEFKDFMIAHRGSMDDDMQGQPFTGDQSVDKNFSDALVTNIAEVLAMF